MKNTTVIALLALFMAQAAYAADPQGLVLPNYPVTLNWAQNSGIDAYFGITFSGIGAGYDVEDATQYNGWCADADNLIYGHPYSGRLYSALDDASPYYNLSQNWDLITYMVNKYRAGQLNACANRGVIQTLIWDYLGQSDSSWESPSASCLGLVSTQVNASGEDFVPGVGEIATVVVDPAEVGEGTVQLILVEIPFPSPEIGSALAAIALASPAFGYLLVKRRK